MVIPVSVKNIVRFCRRRRWALLFINLVAGLFAAPFLYWTIILMPVVLRAAQGMPTVLMWLNALGVLVGLLLLMLAALGAGGCVSTLRKMRRSEDGFLPGEIARSIRRCARTSLMTGAVFGGSLGVASVGLVNLYTLLPAGLLRSAGTAVLLLQLVVSLPLCLLVHAQEDSLQRHPLRAFAAAGHVFARSPLHMLGLLAATALPPLLFFVWQQPLLTLLGFAVIALVAIVPVLSVWQGAARRRQAEGGRYGLLAMLGVFVVLSALVLLVPLLRRDMLFLPAMQQSMQDTLIFLSRQAAENDTLRSLLHTSSVWPLLFAALLGSACCIMAAYACACYRFRLRGWLFAAAVLLQILPMVFSFSSLEQLLRNLGLPIAGTLLGVIWMLGYLITALLLYNEFERMLPALRAKRDDFPGVRLFFYYALRRARLLSFALIALVTLGCWNDALAPFWYMRKMGSFSLLDYVWSQLSGWPEFAACMCAFLAVLALLLLLFKLRRTFPPKPRLPKPSAN